ncbi:hypothetical protein [Planomicrobium okeanokoites]|uniref:HNH endonuclease n=1 Tax=Planomicrobium okeanokoites TaxID=244 RepID=A0ABV7KT56_PLAOK|nr:hypothetical protein [Planomicrobium okeanokoites]TAA67441.1 hypothetical protein D2910_13705 [Planomicrobium okeanokoites]
MPKYNDRFIKGSICDRWHAMRSRCTNPANPAYRLYGGRGITVCEEWQDFDKFYNWSLANGFSHELQIDRTDNDKGYSPENCRWVTASENSYNKSTAVLVEVKGKLYRVPDLAKEYGFHLATLRSRYRNGDRGEYLVRPLSKP